MSSHFDLEYLHLSDFEVKACLGCSICQNHLETMGCSQEDDAEKLLQKIIDADLVLYGTPLYGHSYSGQLKLLMDRHVAMFKFVEGSDKAVDDMHIESFIKDKVVGLVVSCQGPEAGNTELIQTQFDKFCDASLATCLGQYIFPLCKTDAQASDYSSDTLNRLMADLLSIKA